MVSIAQTLVPVLAGLGGVLLGWWLHARTEQRRWLKEQRLEVYASVLQEAERVFQAALIVYCTPDPKGGFTIESANLPTQHVYQNRQDQLQELRAAWFALDHTGNRLRLVGAAKLQEPGRALIEHCLQTFRFATSETGTPEEPTWVGASAEYNELARKFTDAAVADLGFVR